MDERTDWTLHRSADDRWWVCRSDRVVAEVAALHTGEWWVCPAGEALPWSATYPSAKAATEALIAWWEHTHPFGEG